MTNPSLIVLYLSLPKSKSEDEISEDFFNWDFIIT